ncbi:MAG: c-type cytochrome [Pseudomonadota bacterium]
MKTVLSALGVAAVLAFAPTAAFAQGDAKKGERAFKRCAACHKVGPKARNGVGPMLNDLIGRKAGTVEKYKYSKLNLAAGEAGLEWTEENLMAYLVDPSKFLKEYLKANGAADKAKGRSKMVFKLRKEDDRQNVIAYLKTYAATN